MSSPVATAEHFEKVLPGHAIPMTSSNYRSPLLVAGFGLRRVSLARP